ncbi:hypothetical protein ANO11243_044480 [Dothideomycetidae sp. 11243]|nr:hypothetical protein ANO11243_044480 [fungal sp. No.11243]
MGRWDDRLGSHFRVGREHGQRTTGREVGSEGLILAFLISPTFRSRDPGEQTDRERGVVGGGGSAGELAVAERAGEGQAMPYCTVGPTSREAKGSSALGVNRPSGVAGRTEGEDGRQCQESGWLFKIETSPNRLDRNVGPTFDESCGGL